MQFPKLTPLQSRFLACLGTSILLVIIYYSLSPTHFAYAAEIEATLNQDHNHHRIYNNLGLPGDIDWEDEEEDFDIEIASYQSDFGPGVDRSIIGRAASGTFALVNNVPTSSNIAAGEIQYFVFDNSSLWMPLSPTENGLPANLSAFGDNVNGSEFDKRSIPLDEPGYDTENLAAQTFKLKRQNDGGSRKVTITVNTVLQPSANSSFTGPMPQCTLYVSLSAPPVGQSGPGPGNNDVAAPLVEGYAIANVMASNSVYVSVSAPPQSALNGLSGSWNYAIVASIDGSFYAFNSTGSGIFPIDTDSTTGLIATFNLTSDQSDDNATGTLREEFLNATPPFGLFVFNASDPRINGVQNSYAALAEIDMTPITVNTSMTDRGMGANVKEQFYIQGLKAGTTYTAILAYSSTNFSQVWRPVNFTTKSDGNCKLLFGLDFCSDVAYAVPFNGTTDFNTLASLYDNSTYQYYLNFSYSLQQIACNTTSSAQYSLARNCNDCDSDYRNWLCAVSIPRCYDFSAPSTEDYSFLTPRDVASNFTNGTAPNLNQPGLNSSMVNIIRFNSSRNPFIDQTIIAQPYKEVLPCEDLCYELVKSCPAALQFVCPKPTWMLRRSYGEVNTTALANGLLTCNWPNMDWPVLSIAPKMRGSAMFAFWMAGVVMVLLCT